MQQLADHMSLTKGAIYHWEHGNNNPSFEQMVRIAEVTGYAMPAAAPGADTPASLQELSGTEGMLVALYRMLADEDRQQLMNRVQERAAQYSVARDKPQ